MAISRLTSPRPPNRGGAAFCKGSRFRTLASSSTGPGSSPGRRREGFPTVLSSCLNLADEALPTALPPPAHALHHHPAVPRRPAAPSHRWVDARAAGGVHRAPCRNAFGRGGGARRFDGARDRLSPARTGRGARFFRGVGCGARAAAFGSRAGAAQGGAGGCKRGSRGTPEGHDPRARGWRPGCGRSCCAAGAMPAWSASPMKPRFWRCSRARGRPRGGHDAR